MATGETPPAVPALAAETSSTAGVNQPSAASSNPASINDTPSVHSSDGSKSGGAPEPPKMPKWRFWAIFLSLLMCVFLFALDQLIVATAIPKITIQFNALSQLPWLASGFFLPLFALNLIYAQCLEIFPSKHVIMFAVFIFEVGSLLCGVAPNMVALIFGRAVAGAGAAGIFSGGMVVIAELTSLHNRAQYLALFGVVFAIASVVGPLVGGAFSDHVSWRWCFYINLPLGGIALVSLGVFQPSLPPMGRRRNYQGYSKYMLHQFIRCDWVGAAIAMAWAVCFILALQWGGVDHAWNSGSVIACLVMVGVLPPIFFAWEMFVGPERAMFKLRLFARRTIFGAAVCLAFLFGVMMIDVYYLSVALQAVYRFSATAAGVRLLPLIMSQVVALIASARIIPKLGRYKWVIVAGPCFLALGSGLLYTIKYGTPIANLYGFQVLIGIGVGMSLQNCMLAIQFELKKEPQFISAGVGIGTFTGFAGRIIGISLAGSVFENMIQVNLHKYVPQLSEAQVMEVVNDAGAVYSMIPEEYRTQTLVAYTQTLRLVYIIGLPFAVCGIAAALLIKNSKMPTKAEELERKRERDEKEAVLDAEHAKAQEAGAATDNNGLRYDREDKVADVEAEPKAADTGRA